MKMKRFLSLLLTLVMVIGMLPMNALPVFAVEEYEVAWSTSANAMDFDYGTLADAVAAANAAGSTIGYIGASRSFELTETARFSQTQDLTLELDGRTISAANTVSPAISVTSGNLTVTDETTSGSITATGGNVFAVSGGTLTLSGGAYSAADGSAVISYSSGNIVINNTTNDAVTVSFATAVDNVSDVVTLPTGWALHGAGGQEVNGSVAQGTTLTACAKASEVASGYCGNTANEGGAESVKWSLTGNAVNGYTLTISGSGAMADYSGFDFPWESYSSDITNVVIGEGVTKIGDYAFVYCSSLKTVSLPYGLVSIGERCFYGCSSLESITIPDSVTAIPDSCFRNCSKLETVHIGSGVTSIGSWVFYGCTSLTGFTVSESNEDYKAVDGVLLSKDGKTLLAYPLAKAGEYSIPSGVETIQSGAFSYSKVTSVTIPASVTTIEDETFDYCASLTQFVVDGESSSFSAVDGVLYTKDQTTLVVCPGGKGDVTVSEGVTIIGGRAFQGCAVASVTLPESLITIGEYAFYDCTSLSEIVLPAGVTSIDGRCFASCTALTTVSFHSAPTIGRLAFYGCTGLTTLNLYAVPTFDFTQYGTFYDCTLSNITVNLMCNDEANVSTFTSAGFKAVTNTLHADSATDDDELCDGGCGTSLHVHNWSYEDGVYDYQIYAKCNGAECTLTVDYVTITLRALEGIYNGKTAHTVGVNISPSGAFTLPEGALTYSKDGVDLADGEEPIDAGTYKATLTLGEGTDAKTATVTYTIKKADPTIAWANTTATVDYNPNGAAEITAPTVTLVNGETFNGTINYSYTGTDGGGNKVSGSGLPTDAGTYTITASIAEQDNYNSATTEKTLALTISKINPTCTAPTGLTATYGQTLADVTLTNPAGNTAGTWTWADSSTSVGNASYSGYTFKATFTPEDQVNYNTVTDIDVTVTVGKADSSVDTAPKANDLTYTGKDQALVSAGTANGGWLEYALSRNGEYTSNIPTGKDAGDYTVWYKVVGDSNHSDREPESVEVTINKATPSYSTGIEVTASYGDLLSSVALPDGYAWEDGSLSVGDATSTGRTFEATYSNGDPNYYVVENIPINVIVKKVDVTFVAQPGAIPNLTYSGNDQNLVSAGFTNDGELQYALGTDSTTAPADGWSKDVPTGKDAGTYYVWFKVVGDSNHNDTEAVCVTVTIAECPHEEWSDDGICIGCTLEAAAKVTSGSTDTYYSSFDAARSGWTDGTTLTLLADATPQGAIGVTGSRTLDLNGWKLNITNASSLNVQKDAVLTIQDSGNTGTVVLRAGIDDYITVMKGKLIITGGKFTTGSNENQLLILCCSGTVDLSGAAVPDTGWSVKAHNEALPASNIILPNGYFLMDAATNGKLITTLSADAIGYIVKHDHSYATYTAEQSTNSITGWCSCGAELGKVILAAPDASKLTYDGNAKEATATGSGTASGYTVSYSTADGSAPSNAGDYTATLSWGGENVSVSFTIVDETDPTGEILIKESVWKQFVNWVTFGLFCKDTVDVTVTADGTGSAVAKVEYLLSNEALAENNMPTNGWTEITASNGSYTFSIQPQFKGAVYVRITDGADRVAVINSEGIVVYEDSEAGTETIEYTYAENNDKNVLVTFNGNTVKSITCGESTLTAGTHYTVGYTEATIVLKAAYLDTLDASTYTFTVSYNPLGMENSGVTDLENTTFTVTVNKASITPTVSLEDWTYGEDAKTPVVTGNTGNGAVTYLYKVKGAEDSTYSEDAPTVPGSYTVKATVAETTNYESGTATADFTIGTATLTGVSVEQNGTLTYDGNPLTAKVKTNATTVNGQTVTFTYCATENGTYTTTVPAFTGAGTHTVYYKAAAAYHDTVAGSFEVKIGKATVTEPTIESKPYTGQAQTADVQASDLYEVVTNNGGTAKGSYDVVLKLTDSANYKWATTEDATVTLTFTISGAENKWIVEPAINGWTYGETANAPTYEAKFGTVVVTYKDANGKTVENPTAAGSYTAVFTVTATDDYTGLSKEVTFTITKATYNMTGAKWNYTSAFQYDGLAHTVTVTGLPSGVTVKAYTGNSASVVGSYTAKATFTYDEDNYNAPVLADLAWAIENNWNPTEYTTNGSGWQNTDFVITAKDGYKLSTTNTAEGTWVDSLTGSTEGENSITFYVKNETTGAISLAVTESYKLDKTAPTGTVSIDDNKWNELWNTITFGLFFKETKTVKVEVTTDLSGIANVEFYDSAELLSAEQVKAITAWTDMGADYAQDVTAVDAKTFIYYIRITDNAGNVTYISTADGTFDLTYPAISGITDGSTYYTTQKVTVSDTNLKSVTLNTETVTGEITLEGNKEATYTIVATDKAGNETKFTVTMKPIASISAPIDGITENNVNSGNTEVIAEVEAAAAAVDTTNATEEEMAAIKAITDKCDTLQEVIADTAAEYERITDAISAYDPDEVTSADKADLDKLAEDLKALVESGNLTDSEKAALETPTVALNDMIETVAEVTAEADRIADAVGDYALETVKSSDKDEIEQLIKDIDALLATDNLTDEERTALEGEKTKCENLLAQIEGTDALVDKLTEDVGAYDEDTVKSTDKASLEQLLEDITAVIEGNTNITEEEKAELEALADTVEDLLAKIEDVAQAPVTEDTEKVKDTTSENVKIEDKEDLEKAKEDLEDALTENAGNYTEDEKKAIQEEIDRIDDALEAIENVESVEDTISELPDPGTVKPDDEDAIKAITDAKAEYDALTDHEKSLVSEDTKKKLDDLCAALVAYKITDGTDGKYTQGGSKGLTFTANGAYSKFSGILVDNKVVDPKHYTAESGSTVVTVKASYLDTLSTGKHTLTVVYSDGEASCEFTIVAKAASPATGDNFNIILYGSLMVVSVTALVVLLLVAKKRKCAN
ncbi:MAG: leucine-rich repeat protein [Oscillospiraceae bacterium]|nr:leucine-rich repeat protein [Oscillospiraceae bacterium]